MRKIVVSEFLTADGVMQGPGDPNEDREGGFEHGGWQRAFEFDDAQMQKIGQGMQETDTYLFGRKTYEIFARHWPNQPDTDPFAAVLNPRPKYVVSRTLSEPLTWQNSELINEDPIERVRELKESGRRHDLRAGQWRARPGSPCQRPGRRALALRPPVVLGSGKRLFREGLPPLNLELIDSSIAERWNAFSYLPANAFMTSRRARNRGEWQPERMTISAADVRGNTIAPPQMTITPAPAQDGQYIPGVCNIGPQEIARRRRSGHVGLIVTIGALVALVAIGAPPVVSAGPVLPRCDCRVGLPAGVPEVLRRLRSDRRLQLRRSRQHRARRRQGRPREGSGEGMADQHRCPG